jgi:hypothetical protein
MEKDRLIDFERAEVVTPMIYPPKPRLVVRGLKPNPDMEVSLVPLAYVSQPPYYGIQVVGTITADGPHVSQPITSIPYYVELELQGTNGSEGVEVIGATKTEQIPVSTGAPPVATTLPADTSGQRSAGVPTQVPAEVPEQPSAPTESAASDTAGTEPVAEARMIDG